MTDSGKKQGLLAWPECPVDSLAALLALTAFPLLTMAITMTPAAADHLRKFLANRGRGVGVRLGVKTSGCSGMAYVLEFADELESDDQVFENDGVKVVVDSKSLLYLDGTELDYTKEGLNEGFKFNNPNVKDACGCGESFNV